jgi:hypothetical protein
MESPALQVSQGVEGNVAAIRTKSFEVHEVAAGKVWAETVVAHSTNKNVYQNLVISFIILIIVVFKNL